MKSKHEMDMVNGPIFSKILIFAIPLVLSSMLQLLFNAADMIVVGRYSSTEALAAIGSVSALINFFVNFIIGFSVGSNVIVARFLGAGKKQELSKAVHTSVLLSFILGVVIGIFAILNARRILIWMETPSDVIDLSVLYVSIYFAGLPMAMLYNFGSAILRAAGDTGRPLIFLTISGIVNVLLNLFLVKQCGLSVDGVAIATVTSQALSAILVLCCLMRDEADYKVELKKLSIDKRMLLQIIRIGLPASVQSMLFSVSNILIQSSINFFGSIAMAGNTACMSIEGFVYVAMNSIYQTNLSFSSQNYGAGKYDRMKKVTIYCILIVSVVGLILGNLAYLFGRPLISLYIKDVSAIEYGVERMSIICTTYFVCGIMDTLVGSLRAVGCSIIPMIVSLIGVCGLRILWIFTYFQKHHELKVLYMSYPITWVITILAHLIVLFIVWPKDKKFSIKPQA